MVKKQRDKSIVRKFNELSPGQKVTIIGAMIGALAVLIAACINLVGLIYQTDKPIQFTLTAEGALKTASAQSRLEATTNAFMLTAPSTLTSTIKPSLMPTPTPLIIWLNQGSSLYANSTGDEITGISTVPLSIWHVCAIQGNRLHVANTFCHLTVPVGWVSKDFVEFGPTPTSTPPPTFTLTPTRSPTPTHPPPNSETPILDPTVFRGLDRDCIDNQYWYPAIGDTTEVYHPDQCWDLNRWGILPRDGGMWFLVDGQYLGYDLTRGMYLPINKDKVVISFTVRVDKLDIDIERGKDGILAFGVGQKDKSVILPRGGDFLAFRKAAVNKNVYQDFGKGIKNPTTWTAYSFGAEKKIMFVIDGAMSVYSDGDLISKVALPPVSISDQRRFFWIVYQLTSPTGYLDARLSDFMVVEK